MFSQACVKNSVHGGGGVWQGACVAGGMHGREHAWPGDVHGRGAYVVGGACMVGGCMAGEMTIAEGHTHPTGMHSCLISNTITL